MEDARKPRGKHLLKRVWPWLAGLAIVAVVASRVPLDAFRASFGRGNHLALAAADMALMTAVLCSDSLSTWIGLIAIHMRRPFAKLFAVRGATYLLFLLNYAVGQGGFGYYLYRTGASPLRATGATLFLIGTNLATLLLLTSAAWASVDTGTQMAMWWVLVIGCAGFGVYLIVIALRPGFVVRRELLAPLFDAGFRGHAIAMVGRLPHVAVIVLGHWVAMLAWGIPVPFEVAITIMPVVVIASVLPISPAGLGTSQAAFVFFFSAYAAGATPDERAANVLAFGIAHFVYGLIASILVGLVCMWIAKWTGAMPSAEDGAPDPGRP